MKGEIQTERKLKKAKIEHREDKESFAKMDKSDVVKHKKLKKLKRTSEECAPDEPKAKLTKSTASSEQQRAKQSRPIRQRKDKFKDKVPEFLKLVQSRPAVVKEVAPPVARTPEELEQESMKEEKRERMRKKRRDKKSNKGKKIESTVAKDAALQYLSMWTHHRSAWKFQKVRQVWLLSHMYSTDTVEDQQFQNLLEYLEDLKGESKNKTKQEADKILAEAEKGEEGDDGSRDEINDNEKDDGDEDKDDDDDGSGEKIADDENDDGDEEGEKKKRKKSKMSKDKEDVTSTIRYQRARHVLQILA